MPVSWYIVPYKFREAATQPERYPAIDDYTAQITAAGGAWSETEILGNRAIVKVRASAAVLQALAGVFKRLPKDRLDDPLSDLPNAAKTAIRNEILDQGYTLAELQARFGNDLGQYTLRDVLRFMASRRRKERYDPETDGIIFDGEIMTPRSIEAVEAEVSG